MTQDQCKEIDAEFRRSMRAAIDNGATSSDVIGIITRALPEFCAEDYAHARVVAAFKDAAERRGSKP